MRQVVVRMARHEWPQDWPELFRDLRALAAAGNVQVAAALAPALKEESVASTRACAQLPNTHSRESTAAVYCATGVAGHARRGGR